MRFTRYEGEHGSLLTGFAAAWCDVTCEHSSRLARPRYRSGWLVRPAAARMRSTSHSKVIDMSCSNQSQRSPRAPIPPPCTALRTPVSPASPYFATEARSPALAATSSFGNQSRRRQTLMVSCWHSPSISTTGTAEAASASTPPSVRAIPPPMVEGSAIQPAAHAPRDGVRRSRRPLQRLVFM